MRLWDTPVPIPNTTVKTWAADDTILVTVWQNRWLPDLNKIIPYNVRNCMKYNFSAGGCVLYNCGSHEVWRHAERRWDRKRFRKDLGKLLFLPDDCSVSQSWSFFIKKKFHKHCSLKTAHWISDEISRHPRVHRKYWITSENNRWPKIKTKWFL